ncbi:MAG TPA: hypothetical protein VEJ63_02715 [Planctomycetota bacterium]|nr:hypothetical protein [Planctomycetota bacterium]
MMSPYIFIKMHSGRVITLTYYQRSMVYEGLLEGLPRRKWNSELLAAAESTARKQYAEPLTTIAPRIEVLEDAHSAFFRETLGPAEALPPWVCSASFMSECVKKGDGSRLAILWWQSSPDLICPDIQSEIQKLQWEVLAKDEWW